MTFLKPSVNLAGIRRRYYEAVEEKHEH